MTSRLVVMADPSPRGQWDQSRLEYLQVVLAAHYSAREVVLRTENIFPRSRYKAGWVTLEEGRDLPDLRSRVDTYDNLLCLTSLGLALQQGSQTVAVGSLTWGNTSIVSLTSGWPPFDLVASCCIIELKRQRDMY